MTVESSLAHPAISIFFLLMLVHKRNLPGMIILMVGWWS